MMLLDANDTLVRVSLDDDSWPALYGTNAADKVLCLPFDQARELRDLLSIGISAVEEGRRVEVDWVVDGTIFPNVGAIYGGPCLVGKR